MTILVTGASGLIGSHLCKALAEEGRDVVGLVHETRGNSVLNSIARKNFNVTPCDIRDFDKLNAIVGTFKPDTVFHFAAHLPSTANPDFMAVNVVGTSDMLAICHRNKVKNFVYASSMSVYSAPPAYFPVDEAHPTDPDDAYGKSKLIGEMLCGYYSNAMKTIAIRFSSVFGLGDKARVAYHFMQSALAGKPIQVDGDGNQSSDFIYVDDAVRGTLLAMDNGKSGEVYNIGSGHETTVLELAKLVASTTKPCVDVQLSGKPATRPYRFFASTSKAEKELGYRTPLLGGMLFKYREELEGER